MNRGVLCAASPLAREKGGSRLLNMIIEGLSVLCSKGEIEQGGQCSGFRV